MSAPNPTNKILAFVCGTSATTPAKVWTNGRTYDLTTHFGALRWRVHCAMESLKNWPRNLRWRLANRLCRIAMALRGDKAIEGFHCLQNKAASLEDDIFHPLICTGETLTLTEDECNEIIAAAHRLGKIANATSYVDYWRESR